MEEKNKETGATTKGETERGESMRVDRKIQAHFEVVEEYDSRFQKVKIWLMHLEENYNGSYFTKEAVEKALPTLQNTPILGYIEEDKLGNKDFRGHEMELIIEDNGIKLKYLGQAYGVIPETCNPRFEKRVGDDGREREYLVVDGLMWNKWDEAISILEKNGFSGQSMELDEEGLEGYYGKDGLFYFTNFKFYGACLLGRDVLPAMNSSTVELQFTKNQVQETINQKLEEFYQLFSKKQEEVDNTVDKTDSKNKKVEETFEEETQEETEVEEVDTQEEDVEQTDTQKTKDEQQEEAVQEDSQNGEEETDEKEEEEKEEDKEVEEDFSKNQTAKNFELSHEKIRDLIYEYTRKYMESNGIEGYFYPVQIFDTYFYCINDYTEKYYKMDYVRGEEDIVIVSGEEVFPTFLTQDEKNALELLKANYSKLESEVEELKEFKKNSLKEEHKQKADELFATFNELTEEDYEDIKANVHDFTLEEIESKLYEILGRKKASFSTTSKEKSIKVDIDVATSSKSYDKIARLFDKYGVKPIK